MLLGLLLLVALQGAQAPETSPFQSTPGAPDLARFYPERAREREQEGRSLIQCEVQTTGQLAGCVVLEETPPGAGFGEAALRMVPLFRVKPYQAEGMAAAGGTIRIPIVWRLAEDDSMGGPIDCYARQLKPMLASGSLSPRAEKRLMNAWAERLAALGEVKGLFPRLKARGLIRAWMPSIKDDPEALAWCQAHYPGPRNPSRR